MSLTWFPPWFVANKLFSLQYALSSILKCICKIVYQFIKYLKELSVLSPSFTLSRSIAAIYFNHLWNINLLKDL